MSEKMDINLGDIQKTLLLPLWGRAVETKKKKPLLVDKTATQLMENIDHDFLKFGKDLQNISQLSWTSRSWHIDTIITHFLQKHPDAAIINIGCGLDTTFDRVDNGSLLWYDLDLPDVIDLRKKLLPGRERQILIADSFLNRNWISQIKQQGRVLLIAAGVLYYFEEQQIKEFLITMADAFPGGEIVLDAASPIGIKMANKMVIKASGMDEKSFLKWGIKSAKTIEAWDPRLQLCEEFPLFLSIKKKFQFKNKIMALISDLLKMEYIVRLNFLCV